MEMFGIGVIFTGESGIGKSECALDLLRRGHRLVADDAVHVSRNGDELIGEAPRLTFELLEIRGLGIVNIRELYGISSICRRIALGLSIELRKFRAAEPIERLGFESLEESLLGVSIPKFILPVTAGRNLSTLVETAVRVYLLRLEGKDPVEKLLRDHSEMLK